MDKILERKNTEIVKKYVAKHLKSFGFIRTKPTFFTRSIGDKIEFIHLHKFSFNSSFRIHIGIRFLCDSFEAIALNGVDSDKYRPKYKLDFGICNDSLIECSDKIMTFIQEIGIPWFENWTDIKKLISSIDSPLSLKCREDLTNHINGI